MPRFFFDLYQDGDLVTDDEGVELVDLAAVRRQAQLALPCIAAEEIARDGDAWTCTVLVRDEGGEHVYTAALTYAGAWLHASRR